MDNPSKDILIELIKTRKANRYFDAFKVLLFSSIIALFLYRFGKEYKGDLIAQLFMFVIFYFSYEIIKQRNRINKIIEILETENKLK